MIFYRHCTIFNIVLDNLKLEHYLKEYSIVFSTLSPNKDDIKGTHSDYTIYKNVLTFLSAQDVFIEHIRPEFLLTYERYLIFQEKNHDPDLPEISETLNEENFNIFSKVLWTELLLRIFKRFAFDRVLSPSANILSDPFFEDFQKYLTNKLPSKLEDCTENEFKLLKWVEFHYEKQKTILLTKEFATTREVNSFDGESVNNLALLAIIISYCPYTLPQMKDVYPSPSHISQSLHNAFILRKVIDSLHLSVRFKNFCEKDQEFQQILLLTYLYSVLPSFYPAEDLQIHAKLGETGCCQIKVGNSDVVPIGYVASFFGNELDEFAISEDSIVLIPKQTKELKVTYSAKEAKKAKVVLVVSGEKPGQKYAKTRVYSIHGIPDITYCTAEFVFPVHLYQVTTYNMKITSPCATNYVANTYLYLAKDYSGSLSEDLIPIKKINELGLPRQIVVEHTCTFDENGLGIVKLKMCLVVYTERCFFLYFVNNDAGIFCVKISIRCIADEKITETIKIPLASNFSPTEKCRCKTQILNIMCPLVFYIEVPSRNNLLLKALREMFKNFSSEEEIQFWTQHLGM